MILIIDDSPENIFSLKKILELHNQEVDTALSGEEGLKKVLKNNYALIILDVQMPGMDGFEVAETISGYSKAKDTPIIFLSAISIDKKYITKGYASGAVDYITKPVDADILMLKVKTFLKLYEQTRELNEIQQALREEIEYKNQAQSELRERVQELRSILESIPQIAFTAKRNGKIEFVNQHWFNYGQLESEFPPTHPDDKSILEEWNQTIKTGLPLTMEVRFRKRRSEDYRWHLLKALPVKEDEQIMKWVGTFTDIEEQKQSEQKKDEFISIASHELKTPLTSIKAYLQLLQRSIESTGNNVVVNYLQRTQVQIEKLHHLITDLLDISKIESGKLKFNKKLFDLGPVVQSVVETIRQTHEGSTVIIKNNAQVQIYGDSERIEQVIINYLTNALKYSPDSREVELETFILNNKEVRVNIKDKGIGIPMEKQTNIFQKFYRAEDSSSRFQGLGIGLYICAEIIKRHNGKYGVQSEEGKGSLFYFTIPLASHT